MEVPKLDLVTQGVVRTQALCINMVSFHKLSPGRHFKTSAAWGEALLNILHLWLVTQCCQFSERTFGHENKDLVRTQILGKNRPNKDPKSNDLD